MHRVRKVSGKRLAVLTMIALATGLIISAAALSATVAGDLRETSRAGAVAARIVGEINAARAQARDGEVFVRLRLDGSRLIRERSTDGVSFEPDGVLLTLPQGISATIRAAKEKAS